MAELLRMSTGETEKTTGYASGDEDWLYGGEEEGTLRNVANAG